MIRSSITPQLRYQYVGQKILLDLGGQTYPLDLMPTMKIFRRHLKTAAHYQYRLDNEVAECTALKEALEFSGIEAIDHPLIEVCDIYHTL